MTMSMQTKMQLNLEEREERPKHEPSRADLKIVLENIMEELINHVLESYVHDFHRALTLGYLHVEKHNIGCFSHFAGAGKSPKMMQQHRTEYSFVWNGIYLAGNLYCYILKTSHEPFEKVLSDIKRFMPLK
ncbi:hypothetical protein TNCV_3739771 [Trichonephila clavipes]|nr:hypothetical protein TNCV_3739771 [Trichonephila clavipes]